MSHVLANRAQLLRVGDGRRTGGGRRPVLGELDQVARLGAQAALLVGRLAAALQLKALNTAGTRLG